MRTHHPLYAVGIIPRLYAFHGIHALGTKSILMLQAKNPRRRVEDALEDVGHLIQMYKALIVLYIARDSLSFMICLSKNLESSIFLRRLPVLPVSLLRHLSYLGLYGIRRDQGIPLLSCLFRSPSVVVVLSSFSSRQIKQRSM